MEFVRKFEKSKNLETLTLVIFKEGKKLTHYSVSIGYQYI